MVTQTPFKGIALVDIGDKRHDALDAEAREEHDFHARNMLYTKRILTAFWVLAKIRTRIDFLLDSAHLEIARTFDSIFVCSLLSGARCRFCQGQRYMHQQRLNTVVFGVGRA
jgi:hypothetical protein